jgi:hypothetical protein
VDRITRGEMPRLAIIIFARERLAYSDAGDW